MKFERQILLDSAQLYLLLSYNIISEKYLMKAISLLHRLDHTAEMDLSWDQARLLSAHMRLY